MNPATRARPRASVAHASTSAAGRSGVSGAAVQRVPLAGRGDHRSGRAPDVPEADGRVARARGRHAPARGSRRKRSSLTSASPKSSFRAGRSSSRRPCRSAASRPDCWSKATRAGRRRSRATRCIPAASAPADVFAQAAVLGLYDPDRVADAHQPRRDPAVAGVPRRDPRRARRTAAAATGRGAPHPHRVGQLADARRADSRPAGTVPVGAGGTSGIRPAARTRARGAKLAFGELRRRAVPIRSRRRHPRARRRLSRLRARAACATRATSPRAGGPSRRRPHEPAVCDREHADLDRRARRSPAAAETERDRGASRAKSPPPLASRRRTPARLGAARRAPSRPSAMDRRGREGSAGASRREPRASPATASRPSSTRSRTR